MAESLSSLIHDTQAGSSELLRRTVDWTVASLKSGQSVDKTLNDLSYLCHSHSSMVLLQSFHKFFVRIPLNEARIKSWLDMYLKHEAAACQHLANHFTNFRNVLVHSNSGLLQTALRLVETPLNVFCTEGRPAFEGRVMAEKLARTRHKPYLITDMAAFSVISRVEALAFGCDALTSRGAVNKIGTSALAAAALHAGKKVYFLATSEKIVERWSEDFLLRQGTATEIYNGTEAIQVENYYFDLTPLNSISGIFLEGGITTKVTSL
jgi:translation initiation factor 2B subunit (eIF-2B alpha/beta/delta family)